MNRTPAALVLLVSITLLYGPARAGQDLPLPPIPPARPPSQDAPVPNMNVLPPLPGQARPSVTLNTDINRREPPSTSYGYAPGARWRTDDPRKPLAVPGIQLHVPIQ